MTFAKPIFEALNMWRVFGDHRDSQVVALQDLNFAIFRGERIAVTGPSGSGKSTLLAILGLLDNASRGHLLVGEQAVSELSAKQLDHIRMHKIGFIFQDFQLVDVLSVKENVEYFLYRQGLKTKDRNERVEECLRLVDLWDKRNKKPHQLSGGQKQRVAIARAIAKRPEIIIADEPTANLDSHTGKKIYELLRDLNEQIGITMVMATHDRAALKYVDRILNICDGQLSIKYAEEHGHAS